MTERNAHDVLMDHVIPDASEREAFERRALVSAIVNRMVEVLETVRDEMDLEKSELAELAKMNPASVRRILTQGSPNPEARTLVQLADAMGYDFALVSRTNDSEPIVFSAA
jgi:phosphoserine phosphatase